jgi:hypothetical protein
MLIDTVIQNADAVHVLLESRATSTLALDAQARAALEAAAQAWWLLEPRLGGRARVAPPLPLPPAAQQRRPP